jgi:hypothetical protein
LYSVNFSVLVLEERRLACAIFCHQDAILIIDLHAASARVRGGYRVKVPSFQGSHQPQSSLASRFTAGCCQPPAHPGKVAVLKMIRCH